MAREGGNYPPSSSTPSDFVLSYAGLATTRIHHRLFFYSLVEYDNTILHFHPSFSHETLSLSKRYYELKIKPHSSFDPSACILIKFLPILRAIEYIMCGKKYIPCAFALHAKLLYHVQVPDD